MATKEVKATPDRVTEARKVINRVRDKAPTATSVVELREMVADLAVALESALVGMERRYSRGDQNAG